MTIPNGTSDFGLPMDELIGLILGGQVDLYEEVIRRYQGDVMAVVGGLLADRGQAEDLVQQVFVDAYFALPRFELGRDFGPWIRTIARNAVREQLRKQWRYDRRLRAYHEILAARLADDRRADHDERMLVEALNGCINRLPEREATAIRLRYHEDLSMDEIAAVLGNTAGTVRNLLCRARTGLRECLQLQRSGQ
ncbi:MAG: sigma-70 family RNA polymerase sigma factor [Planctomycetota bacterium]